MKFTLHIPTEQFGYIEVEVDRKEDIARTYFEVKEQWDARHQEELKKVTKNDKW